MHYYRNGIRYEAPDPTAEELAAMQAEETAREAEYWQSISYEDAVNELIRQKYTASQEFAILRQKDEKPTEYAEYYAFCEDCKAIAKAKKEYYK